MPHPQLLEIWITIVQLFIDTGLPFPISDVHFSNKDLTENKNSQQAE